MEENIQGEALIRYRAVNVAQQELDVLEDVNFELKPGEFVYFIGKVGSGKTSLLKTFYAELDLKSADEALVLGHDMMHLKRKHVPDLRRRMGIVFQDFQLLTDRTVQANLSFVLKATGWRDRNAINERITEVLEQVGMSGKGYKMPNELSGGEQQRIVIARAILNRPAIILADEPTGNLDPETGHRIVELLHGICHEGAAVVMTTHNLQLLEQFPGTVYRFADHRIQRAEEVEIPESALETEKVVEE
jgi:cell division transport system ATP-binding protein